MKTESFKNRKVNTGKLLEYGFVLDAGVYVYKVPLVGGQMELTVEVSHDGEVATTVEDAAFGEEYVLHLVPHAEGAFVGQVRTEYGDILDDIAKKCFDLHIFREDQSRALIRHVEETYGDKLEFLWEKLPMAAVWRRKDNRKWYATVMVLKASKLLPDGDGMIEVMDLRIDPKDVDSTVDGRRFFPGYHMNKRHWYTVILNGSVPTEELFLRIAESYRLAKK
ncbi:MAG: MmcQ/YjbR family DNA-binding protein [Clostridia bacterium]|nr:MmcQ/YjbR family DNA-binding protein [Clostridia bacterium]